MQQREILLHSEGDYMVIVFSGNYCQTFAKSKIYRGKLRKYPCKYGHIDNILLKSRKTNLCSPRTAPCALQREWLSLLFTSSSGLLYGPALSSQVSDPKT